MIVHQSENASVEWLEKEKIVVKTFYRFLSGEEIRTVFNSGLEQLKKEKGCKWLSDNRKLVSYAKADVEWINNSWFPRALKSGWKYWALIEPETPLGELSMNHFIEFYKQKGIVLRVFNTPAQGISWLASMK